MKGKFDLIIFDWDGTLVDSIDWIVHCLTTAAEEQGYQIPDKHTVTNTIGLSIQKSMVKLFPDIDQKQLKLLAESYQREFFSQDISENHLFEGVKNMLSLFKKNKYQLAVATGKTRKGLDWAMHGTGVINFFDVTRTADETASKPKPMMLEQIIMEMKIKKQRVVMVGDSVHDMEMANNAGIACIAVSCGANSAAELEHHNPILNLSNTTELLNYF